MSVPDHTPAVTEWLRKLAALGLEGAPTGDGLAELAKMLAAELPPGAFSEESRIAVARDLKRWPPPADLRTRITAEWNNNRPWSAPEVRDPELAHLSVEELSWHSFYLKRRGEIFGKDYKPKWSTRKAEMDNLESLIRDQAFQVWLVISGQRYTGGKPVANPEAVARSVDAATGRKRVPSFDRA